MAVVAGAFLLAVGVLGPAVLNYASKMAFGAVVFLIALDFFVDWLWKTARQMVRAEYVVLTVIFLTVVLLGFLEAIALGILICVVFFALTYSSLSHIRKEGDGSQRRSDVDRSPAETEILDRLGRELVMFQLEGYVFFASASALVNRIQARIRETDHGVSYVLIDFRWVSGLDSSALFAFTKLRQLAEREGMTLVFVELSADLEHHLDMGGILEAGDGEPVVRLFGEADFGIEWVEDRLIEREGGEQAGRAAAQALIDLMGGDERAAALIGHFERHTVAAGSYLYRFGDEGEDLYLIESGTIALMVPLEQGGDLRLRKLGPGTLAGELDFYDGTLRDADALAETDGVIWRLPAERLRRIDAEAPGEAALIHKLVARTMSWRVAHLSDELRAVLSRKGGQESPLGERRAKRW